MNISEPHQRKLLIPLDSTPIDSTVYDNFFPFFSILIDFFPYYFNEKTNKILYFNHAEIFIRNSNKTLLLHKRDFSFSFHLKLFFQVLTSENLIKTQNQILFLVTSHEPFSRLFMSSSCLNFPFCLNICHSKTILDENL